jgi:hypothetical protein
MSISRTAVLLSAVALSGVLLAGCGGAPGAGSSPEPTATATTPSPEPTPVETAEPDPDAVAAAMRADIDDAMNSGNTAALEGYLAASVHVTYCASEYEGDVTDHGLVIQNITDVTSTGATWDFDLPASVVQGYHDSSEAYYDDFPAGAVVGLSSEDQVISFAVTGAEITRVFICLDAFALS